jgi:ABC-2 type transport system permease protein
MKRQIQVLYHYVMHFVLQWFGSRSFVFTLAINQAMPPLVGLAVWTSALPGQRLSSYYLALLFTRLATVSYENHTFSGRIYNGELADDLLLPAPVVLRTLGENLALRCWHLLIGLPLMLAIPFVLQVEFELGHVVLALPAVGIAACLQFLFTYTLALTAFWTERAHGMAGFGATLIFLLGGEAAPITLLPGGLRTLGEALPFRAMHGFPAEIAAGTLTQSAMLTGYAWQILWLGCFVLIAAQVWRAGIRRYTAVGG